MGAYDKFKGVEAMGVRAYIEPGDHVLLVRRTEQGPSKNPQTKGVEKTVIEFKIVKTSTMGVGKICSLVELDNQQGYLGNVNAFVAGILGLTTEELFADPDFEQLYGSIFGMDSILVDTLVHCVAQHTDTQAGGKYTAKTWDPVDAADYAQYGLIAPQGAWTRPAVAA